MVPNPMTKAKTSKLTNLRMGYFVKRRQKILRVLRLQMVAEIFVVCILILLLLMSLFNTVTNYIYCEHIVYSVAYVM